MRKPSRAILLLYLGLLALLLPCLSSCTPRDEVGIVLARHWRRDIILQHEECKTQDGQTKCDWEEVTRWTKIGTPPEAPSWPQTNPLPKKSGYRFKREEVFAVIVGVGNDVEHYTANSYELLAKMEQRKAFEYKVNLWGVISDARPANPEG